jgi:hypothetical protein
MAAVMTTLAQPACAASSAVRSARRSKLFCVSRSAYPHRHRTSAVKVRAAAEAVDNTERQGVARTKTHKRKATAVASLVASFSAAALVALPAFAEEAAAAASAAEISPFAGVVDVTVLGVVGLLAVQGNKKAEAAKAAQGGGKKEGKKGGKKK